MENIFSPPRTQPHSSRHTTNNFWNKALLWFFFCWLRPTSPFSVVNRRREKKKMLSKMQKQKQTFLWNSKALKTNSLSIVYEKKHFYKTIWSRLANLSNINRLDYTDQNVDERRDEMGNEAKPPPPWYLLIMVETTSN
jgi:hypothetical protein